MTTKKPDADPNEAPPVTEPQDEASTPTEWPSEGGCYVRQPDGTLTRED